MSKYFCIRVDTIQEAEQLVRGMGFSSLEDFIRECNLQSNWWENGFIRLEKINAPIQK